MNYSHQSEFLSRGSETENKGHRTVFKLFYSKFTKGLKIKKRVPDKIFNKLQSDPEFRNIPQPMVCWKNPRSLRSYFVKSKIRD
jgi:hypothetical protein